MHKIWKKFRGISIGSILIFHLMYLITRIYDPSPPVDSDSEISNTMEISNYKSDNTLLNNIYKYSENVGYFNFSFLIPLSVSLGITLFLISDEFSKKSSSFIDESIDEIETDQKSK